MTVRQKKDKGATRTVSVRLSAEKADQLAAEAAARHITVSTLIADRLFGRERPVHVALAALGSLIAIERTIVEQGKLTPATEAELKAGLQELLRLARQELVL